MVQLWVWTHLQARESGVVYLRLMHGGVVQAHEVARGGLSEV